MYDGSWAQIFSKALELEMHSAATAQLLQGCQERKEQTQSEQPPKPPVYEAPPQPTMPVAESKVKFNWWIAFVPCAVIMLVFGVPQNVLLSAAWLAIYYFVIYKGLRKREEEAVHATAEYQAAQRMMQEEFERAQQAAQTKHEEEMATYKQVTLPEFECKKEETLHQIDSEIADLTKELENITSALADFYQTAELIPEQYRTIEALEYMCAVSAKADVEPQKLYQWYEEQQQKKLDEEVRRQQQSDAFVKGIVGVAIGAAAAAAVGAAVSSNSSDAKAQREAQREAERAKRQADMDRMQQDMEKFHEKNRRNYMRQQIIRTNQERRRKGQPELPVPPYEA